MLTFWRKDDFGSKNINFAQYYYSRLLNGDHVRHDELIEVNRYIASWCNVAYVRTHFRLVPTPSVFGAYLNTSHKYTFYSTIAIFSARLINFNSSHYKETCKARCLLWQLCVDQKYGYKLEHCQKLTALSVTRLLSRYNISSRSFSNC